MQRFDSKIDILLAIILVSCALVCLLAALKLLSGPGSAMPYLLFIIIVTVGTILPLWLLAATYYLVDDSVLKIISGPFRWQIKLADIHNITPSDSPLSGPALSFDRLAIHYASGKQLLVSPKDQQAFIEALQKSAPAAL